MQLLGFIVCGCLDIPAVPPAVRWILKGLIHSLLKGSYDANAKNNIIWCIWCNASFLHSLR